MKRLLYCIIIAIISSSLISCETNLLELEGSNDEAKDYAPENPLGLTISGICGWIDFEFKSNNSAILHLVAGSRYDYFENKSTTMSTSNSRAIVKYKKLGKNKAYIEYDECWVMYIYNTYRYREFYDCVRGNATIIFTSKYGGTVESEWYTNGSKYDMDPSGSIFLIKY